MDWDREKWRGSVASKFIRGGEKNAVKYADEIIVLSKDVQKYFFEAPVWIQCLRVSLLKFRQDQVAINVTLNQWNDVVISLFMIAGMQIT